MSIFQRLVSDDRSREEYAQRSQKFANAILPAFREELGVGFSYQSLARLGGFARGALGKVLAAHIPDEGARARVLLSRSRGEFVATIAELMAAGHVRSQKTCNADGHPALCEVVLPAWERARHSIQIGARVGNYQLEKFLGRGGFATAMLARDLRNSRQVVLKFGALNGGKSSITSIFRLTDAYRPRPLEVQGDLFRLGARAAQRVSANGAEVDSMLLGEAARLAEMRHPSVVKAIDVVEASGRPVLVLEYLNGKTLQQLITADANINLNLFLDIARVLQQAGSHGDLKPENIIVGRDQLPMLIDPAVDCGLLRMQASVEYNPLLLRGEQADVFALGGMLYKIAGGSLPFESGPWEYAGLSDAQPVGEREAFSKSFFLSVADLQKRNPKVSKSFAELVYGALHAEWSIRDFIRESERLIRAAT